MAPLKTPYRDLVPRPSQAEFDSLKADIELNGVQDPIYIDSAGNVLDGHTRLEIDPKAPTRIAPGSDVMTDAEKQAFVIRSAINRRHLSAEQRDELRKSQQRIATELAVETIDDNGEPRWSQAEIGAKIGVSNQTVSEWLKSISVPSGGDANTPSPPDDDEPDEPPPPPSPKPPKRKKKRVKLDEHDKEEIWELSQAGKTQNQIASEFKITQGRVAQVLKQFAKKQEQAAAEVQAAKDSAEQERQWVVTNDLMVVPCDALITDPPYGILDQPWEPAELESFTKEWAKRWNKCGADLLAVFWSQRHIWDGRKWFDACFKDYDFQQLLVWHYPNNKSPQSRMGFKQTWEPIFLYRKTGSEKQILVPGKDWGDGMTDFDCHVAAVPQTNFNDAEKKQHPAQKPVSVMKWLVGCLTRKGELIADPFCGSGTTGIASIRLGRRFHGIDTDEEYRRLAERRISRYGE